MFRVEHKATQKASFRADDFNDPQKAKDAFTANVLDPTTWECHLKAWDNDKQKYSFLRIYKRYR
jgi:hypothetical protein